MPAPKKTLVLHIGMGKTGTTAIQRAFWANRAALARAGIAYPATGVVAGAHHLVSPHHLPHLTQGLPWRRYLAPADWMARVAALPQPLVFMSSELVSSAEPDHVAAFCAALAPVFDLRVLCYLRRQDDMIAATWAQAVKGGVQRRPLAAILDGRLPHYDYALRLAPWEAALGRDALLLRPYERGQFHAGDLIRDVALHGLGLPDLPPGFRHDPAAMPNTHLPIAATEFKRLLNILLPDRRRSQAYLGPLSACPPDPRGSHFLGRADRARLIGHYADSNAHVARHYMGRPAGDLFHDALPPDAPETPPATGTAELRAMARLVGDRAPGLLHDLAAEVARTRKAPPRQTPGDRTIREAADRLAAALEGMTLPRRPLGHRLAGLVRSLADPRRSPPPPPAQAPRANSPRR
jgi:hypothetical protein